jgi:hypothetical protein
MKMSHLLVLLFALAAGFVIGAMRPGLLSTVTGGALTGGS